MRRSYISRRLIGALGAAVLVVLIAGWGPAEGGPAATRFGRPVRVTPENGWGFEPATTVDRFGNIFVTARKETTQLAIAPDGRSPTSTRSMSWLWSSTDGGASFANLPGLPLDAEAHDPGIEPDIALDDAGHLYFVDMRYADATITRWTVSGLGEYSLDFHRTILPGGQLHDRPWVEAHGDGRVIYLANAGDKELYPLGTGDGDGFGPGRFSVYRSVDGGQTFETRGYTLRDSGACRPAADRAPGSQRFYVVCTNDAGTLWAYASEDDGASFSRSKVGSYNADAETYDWPIAAVGPDGTVWALHVDAEAVERIEDPIEGTLYGIVTNKLMLYRSRDHGRTWTGRDITPARGRYRWPWLAISPVDGAVGIGFYHRADPSLPWRVYGSIFSPGGMPALSSPDPEPAAPATSSEPPGELMGAAFGRDGRLSLAWTRVVTFGATRVREVWFARSTTPASVKGTRTSTPPLARPKPDRLPATGLGDLHLSGLAALVTATALGLWAAKRRGPAP